MTIENNKKPRVIAFYLPQYYPIPENDKWWGKGFTEWTNVSKAKPLFRGHYQPHIPADLGFYDLRIPEPRQAQADMAKEYGIEGFCYWHYWFGNGNQLLERPFNEVLKSGKPDFPFCLAWANETWKGFDHGLMNRNILIEQQYLGVEDYTSHFYEVLPAFKDKRYIKIDNMPLFLVYKPFLFPDMASFILLWQMLAQENGLKGIFFVGQTSSNYEIKNILNLGFAAVNTNRIFTYVSLKRSYLRKCIDGFNRYIIKIPSVYKYKKMIKYFSDEEDKSEYVFPTIFPNWDHSPRSGSMAIVFHNSTPELFEKHVHMVFKNVKDKPSEKKVVFLKSWNEWAEGNYMEPDLKFGKKYLEALRRVLSDRNI